MKLKLERIYKGSDYTIGKLYIDDVYFCDTLEDVDRGLTKDMDIDDIKNKKKSGITAIPIGEYEITLEVVSPKYSNFSRYKWSERIEAKIPRLIGVPGFSGILIHPSGNYPKDTDGCILVGKNTVKGAVMNSTDTFFKLYDILTKAEDKIFINITN